MRILLPAACVAWLGAGGAGQAAQVPAGRQAADDLPVHTVRVDAIVEARGAAVDSLRPEDFEVREDGRLMTLDEARFVTVDPSDRTDDPQPVDSPASERREARRGNTRLVAIFLDEYHISPGPVAERVRDGLRTLIDQALGPRDLVVVMKPLDSLYAIRLTHDRDEARRIIESLEGRKGDYTPRQAYEREAWAGAPERIEAARQQVAVSALQALAVHLGTLGDLRKTLIVVTEGLAPTAPRRGQEYLATIDSVVRAANRARVAIYPVDPRPSASAGSSEEEQAVARALANDTNGRVMATTGDLATALNRVVADTSAYYMLAYRSTHREDGRVHPVAVSVKRAGLALRARTAYWAPSADDRLRAAALARAAMPPPLVEPAHVSPLIRTWFGLSRGSGGKTRVTFVWEPAARVPGERAPLVAARLEVTALARDNSVLFEGPVLATGPGTAGSGRDAPAYAAFEIPPGPLRVRSSILDASLRPIDADVRDIAVRDLGAAVTLGTPALMRARNAREFRMLDADAAAVPVAAREFSRTERLLIRIPVYWAGDGPVRVAARLLTRAGQALRPLEATAASDGVYRIDMPLAGFAAGEYFVELSATGAAGTAKELVNFRVTN